MSQTKTFQERVQELDQENLALWKKGNLLGNLQEDGLTSKKGEQKQTNPMLEVVSKTIKEVDRAHNEVKKVLLTLKRSAKTFL